MVFEWYAREYDDFPEMYIEIEQIAGAKNDQVTRKCQKSLSKCTELNLRWNWSNGF
jgi:hypothetical protein